MYKLSISLLILLSAYVEIGAQSTKPTVDNLREYAVKDTAKGWKKSGIINATFGQSSLTNWAAGGDKQTVSANFLFNAAANYLTDRYFWDNSLVMEYGVINSQSSGSQKASDRLNLNSVAGRNVSRHWSIAALVNFKTQFTKGYNYPDREHFISTLMAPAYFDVAMGVSYKPHASFKLYLSPLAERVTIVMNDSLSSIGAFGVPVGKKSYFETGAYLMANLNHTFGENFSIISSLYMFTPYNSSFGCVDTNWDIMLNYKLNKYFSATLNTAIRYYDDEIAKIQFKEIFGLGLTYSF
jgi:hypothetical protein